MVDKKLQGKRNRRKGSEFERKVRLDLEKNGWIVSKWNNTIEQGKLIPAKRKFNPFLRVLSIGNGFPDFIAFKHSDKNSEYSYDIIGVECKVGKYLDKSEKEKCKWLLDNKIFSKILVAYKGKKRGEICYKEC